MIDLDAEIRRAQRRHPEWRYGQAVWNVASERFPRECDGLLQTSVDPFYSDIRVPLFLAALRDEGAKFTTKKIGVRA